MGFLEASAVAGRALSALRRGRTGAEDNVPTEVVDTFREVDIAVAGRAMLECELDFFGVGIGSAEPGLEGRFLSLAALFCAAIVSLIEGLVGTEVVL